MLRAVATPPGEETIYVEMTQEEIDERLAEEAAWAAEQARDKRTPLEKISDAVLSLPVDKRIDQTFGGFVTQCLHAIQFNDMESLSALINRFQGQTADTDYLAILAAAKSLFNLP